ncbi:hypothetical protein CBE37_00480 [bacterium TMED277]|nr:MAG: hypothetical protein CBE37_00480 [bacterium TMED277]
MRNFHKPERSEVYSQNGMIATSHPLAAKVGINTLSKGGNAIDAAISAALMLVLCEPQSTGLYGDAFAIFKTEKSDKIYGLNGSGKSPSGIDSSLLINAGHTKMPANSVHSITLPGAVALFEELANKFGKLGLSELCSEPIKYAEEGVVVSPRVSFDWHQSHENFSSKTKEHYLINGKVPKPGDVFRAPGQAVVFRKISSEGAKGFYQSEITEDFVDSLKKLGGLHNLEDFKNVDVEYVNPVNLSLKDGSELFELPPNGQGITALMMRKLMELSNLNKFSEASFERVHLEAEIAKLAYSARNKYIGDPHFSEINHEVFLDDVFLKKLANEISMDKLIETQTTNSLIEKSKDTVLVTAADKQGNSISLIFSIFDPFGSCLCSERFGLIFHNRGAGFVLEKDHPNELKPNKRPFHTIIPAILKEKNGSLMPFGVMGGQYQANGHARILSNILDYKMDLQQALNFQRSFYFNGYLSLEEGYGPDVEANLSKIGHRIDRPKKPIGGAQLVKYDSSGFLIGASDPRKDGCALGF